MRFFATEEQVKQIAANAVNASAPMGLGMLHFDSSRTFNASEFNLDESGLHLDYVQGRMVKLNIISRGVGEWEIPDNPTPDYQSWCRTYRTTQALVNSVVSAPIPAP